jgi:hypothetical protein
MYIFIPQLLDAVVSTLCRALVVVSVVARPQTMPEPTIRYLLEDIELGRIVLPEVRKEFKWSGNDVKNFLDSLCKKYPVGYIFLWRQKTQNHLDTLRGRPS